MKNFHFIIFRENIRENLDRIIVEKIRSVLCQQ